MRYEIKHNKQTAPWIHKPCGLYLGLIGQESITTPDVINQIANGMNTAIGHAIDDVPIETKPLPENKSELEKLVSSGYKFLTKEDGKWLEKSPEHKSNISKTISENVDDNK